MSKAKVQTAVEPKDSIKRPVTAFLLFRSDEAAKGNKMNSKDAGKAWQDLTEDQKQPFFKRQLVAKEEYDKYMKEVEGKTPKQAGKPTAISTGKIRVVCTSKVEIKPILPTLYKGLAKVMVLHYP